MMEVKTSDNLRKTVFSDIGARRLFKFNNCLYLKLAWSYVEHGRNKGDELNCINLSEGEMAFMKSLEPVNKVIGYFQHTA